VSSPRTHGRAPWPAPEDLDAAQRAVRDAIVGGPRGADPAFALTDAEGRLEGPFNAMVLAPEVGAALQGLGSAIRYRTALTGREREIAILVVAHARNSDFERYAHERVAARCGLADADLAALREGRAGESWSADEILVHATTRALVTAGDLTDQEFGAASGLGTRRLAELITLVGYYDALALSLRVWRVPLPADAEDLS